MTERVLFFAAHAGAWVHAFPEALVGDAIRNAGGDVIHVGCDGALRSFCVVMATRGLRETSSITAKNRACTACRRNRSVLRGGFGFPSFDFESVLTPADEQRIEELVEHVRRDDVVGFVVDGVRVGRAALYEYLLHHKRSGLTLEEAEWPTFKLHVANALRSSIAAVRILDREQPTRLVIYNTLYAVNAVWRAVADARQIPVYALHAGPNLAHRLGTLLIGRDSTVQTVYRMIAAWPEHSKMPCTAAELAEVTDHFIEVLAGTNVFAYSTAKAGGELDWRKRFGIAPGQKLLVATMSSYDEYVAARAVGEMPSEADLLFPTQIEWIRALVAWIRNRPELFLLIRVHPREYPNKRDGVKSAHAHALERELVNLPENVRVNWPADEVSLYDIAEHADVILNAWSSVGKEMSLLGRPVVVYCPGLLMYAPGINDVAETAETYFAAIETALREGWSFDRIRKAYRWCAVEYVRAIVDIRDGFNYRETRATSIVARARNFAWSLPYVRPTYDLLKRAPRLREQSRIANLILSGGATLLDTPGRRTATTEAQETEALRHELGRLVGALYGNATSAPEPGSLRAHLSAAIRSSHEAL